MLLPKLHDKEMPKYTHIQYTQTILNKGRISPKNQPFGILRLHSLLFLMPPHADL